MNTVKIPGQIKPKNLAMLIIGLPASIFLAEVIAMTVIYFLDWKYFFKVLMDSFLTTILVMPLIYLLSYRPLYQNIVKREEAEKILRFRLRMMEFSISHTMEEMLQIALDEIEGITGATIGFFHFLLPDQETIWLQAWSSNTLRNMCQAEGKGSHYSLDKAGVWADCVRLQQPVVHNHYALLENRKGTPPGHAKINRELTVPIMRDNLVVAVLGIGNKPDEFTTRDVELVSSLADFAWDVIDHILRENAFKESEAKFRTLANWTQDWEQWVDVQGAFLYNSPSCEQISGYTPEEFDADHTLLTRIVHPDDRDILTEHMKMVHDSKAGKSSMEFRIIDRDGNVHWLDHICHPLFDENHQFLGRRITNREVTRRKLAEMEIVERNQKELLLTQTINTMQLETARDIHDTLGQNIGYLRMKLDHLNELDLMIHPNLKTEISGMLSVANETYDQLRGTLDVLRLGGLDNLSILLKRYSKQVEQRSRLKIHLSHHGETRSLTPKQVRQIFFVFREALSNIEKHASAREVSVELNWMDEQMTLMIADDGKGFNAGVKIGSEQYGIKFMQERIEEVNGSFAIQATEGSGTRIDVILPVENSPVNALETRSND